VTSQKTAAEETSSRVDNNVKCVLSLSFPFQKRHKSAICDITIMCDPLKINIISSDIFDKLASWQE